MKMRDFVDNTHGAGAWDRMHAAINRNEKYNGTAPMITVDGILIEIIPGIDPEVTLEEVRTVARKRLREARAFRQMTIIPRPPGGSDAG